MKAALIFILFFLIHTTSFSQQKDPIKVFISVDMEGIGGIGTPKMVSSSGKDYTIGRKLMTEEVNAVVAAIYEFGPAEILINDSHGDMQNLLHTELDPRVKYIQSNIKPLGMVQGLDESFDGAIFIGYHARAGTEGGFLAHTGSGSVKGLWLNGREVGEGGLNAYFAGALNVPVIMASGDRAFTEQFGQLVPAKMVVTKEAIGSSAARLIHPDEVRKMLMSQTKEALQDLQKAKPLETSGAVTFRMRVAHTTRADILMGIPEMKRIDGVTVEYDARNMDEAYRLIRISYKYITW